jgi:hypothetical protein
MPKVIVAIGGGLIRTSGTAPLDREIVSLAGKKNPNILLIPTATSDSDLSILGAATGAVFRLLI